MHPAAQSSVNRGAIASQHLAGPPTGSEAGRTAEEVRSPRAGTNPVGARSNQEFERASAGPFQTAYRTVAVRVAHIRL
ncbi:hypothetical protein THAOC_12426 [Thalassiosira oceanica]|uniref:Uncharacterized protein n=1 Tax=Thalassiosira oceanica TaxID=159749 RepID=K0T865_THAOC|nr:hypothetical protein THAOC_12426 [Thalassiosira oceanica]|eukprot:EJK66637.1 hypothetical protein THAOC_12426 [Thalassiosira oceanica]